MDLVAVGSSVLAVVGAITTLALLGNFLRFSYTYLLHSSGKILSKFRGEWALITGASSGIGAGLARAFASKGVNVVLVARSRDKLDELADFIKDKYSVETKVITFDFVNATDAEWEEDLLLPLENLPVTILANNVGVNVAFPTDFVDIPAESVDNMLKVNINAADKLTRKLLPKMIAVKKGIILFMSSAAGVLAPSPLLSPYAGTKAYLDSFALALSGEVIKSGIYVHSVTPFFVESAMAKMRASFTVPSADAFAKSTINAIGGQPRICPHWPHAVMASALGLLPLSSQVDYVAKLHTTIRKKALRKKARLEAEAEQKS